jgi:arsenate reductase
MAEMGVDISSYRSKSVKEFIGQKFDYVITVCDNAKQTCPMFPGNSQKIHWNLDDPAEIEGAEEKKLIIFKKVRDQIRENISKFLKKNLKQY